MPRATANKLYRTFVKGLITEASPLTYPENASINEDNCIIYQAGNRSRRKGLDFETDHELNQHPILLSTLVDTAVTEHIWLSADNKSSKNFTVLQLGRTLYFYDMSSTPLSLGLKMWTVDLQSFAVAGQDTSKFPVQAVSGKGYLFVVSAVIEPFLIQYSSTSDSIATQRIYIQIRDFKGLDDGLANDEEPATLSAEHDYNLRNQGWIDPGNGGGGSSVTYYTNFGAIDTYTQATTTPISDYFTAYSRYPGNNKQWWVAKDATTGAFDPTLLGKVYFGNNRAPRGHYVVEAFNIDRTAVSGVAAIPVESTTARPSTTAFFSGRVWYGIDSTVYFSQILDDKRKAGMCFMEADPTSEDINDLIATDGGVIPIPEMIGVSRLVPIGGGILCFATNGIWFVSGTQAGFTATDITVTKVSPIGTDSPMSIIHVQDKGGDLILWWSKVGVQALTQKSGMFGTIDNKFDTNILSLETIQTFYNNISATYKPYVKAHYDPSSNTVQWLFNDGSVPYNYGYNRVLNFDLTLQAFYPWTFTPINQPSGPYVFGVFDPLRSTGQRNGFTKYVVMSGDNSNGYFAFGEVNNDRMADWNVMPFMSFVETGYELMDDAMRNKQAMYVYCYFRRTEMEYVQVGEDYNLDKPSSCFFQIKWDWSNSEVSNRWSQKMQAYRLLRIPTFNADDLNFDTGFPIIVTRNKVRGHGRAIQFRFENENIGSDFDLLGWAVPLSGNTQP